MSYQKLPCENGEYIAYKKLSGAKASIVFLGGLASNMNGAKATAIYQFCKANDISLVLFDYLGHGSSSGNFSDCTVSDWCNNCIQVIDELTAGKQIIVGSSLGGWLMLLVALQLPQRVSALIGIAPAPDFTENLIFNTLSREQKAELASRGAIDLVAEHDKSCVYKITNALIEDGRKNLLLNKETIDITCPVRLLHSINDKDVPYQTSLDLIAKIKSTDVEAQLVKSADHNMSDKRSLRMLFNTISESL